MILDRLLLAAVPFAPSPTPSPAPTTPPCDDVSTKPAVSFCSEALKV